MTLRQLPSFILMSSYFCSFPPSVCSARSTPAQAQQQRYLEAASQLPKDQRKKKGPMSRARHSLKAAWVGLMGGLSNTVVGCMHRQQVAP